MTIKNLLESEGITIVSGAGDGAHALQMVEKEFPNLVIVDVDIPMMSVIEVVVKLKKILGYIIIVVFAKNDLFYGKRSADVGENAFISKKLGVTNIIAAIHASLNGYSYFSFLLRSFMGSAVFIAGDAETALKPGG